MSKKYNRTNFFKHTFCEWESVMELPSEKPDYSSRSGSHYYFVPEGVFRKSNHWGRAANCRWRLKIEDKKSQQHYIGYANWTDFYPNNDTDTLFCIEADLLEKKVKVLHKDQRSKSGSLCRTAAATQKRVQVIRSIWENNQWAKYIDYEDYNELTAYFITKLLETNWSMVTIKTSWNGEAK